MKKSALYVLPALGCLLIVLWLQRTRPMTAEATRSSSSEDEVTATPSSTRSALTSDRQAAFARTRSESPLRAATAPAAAPSETGAEDTLRSPVIQAIRADMNGEQKRKAMLDAIRRSGESDEEWTAEAEDAFETWSQAMPEDVRPGISVAEPRCFHAGCVADVTFADQDAYRAAARAFRSISDTRSGHGGRVQTPSEAQGKRVVASWIMLRPRDF